MKNKRQRPSRKIQRRPSLNYARADPSIRDLIEWANERNYRVTAPLPSYIAIRCRRANGGLRYVGRFLTVEKAKAAILSDMEKHP